MAAERIPIAFPLCFTNQFVTAAHPGMGKRRLEPTERKTKSK
jgi:hypothetical protein